MSKIKFDLQFFAYTQGTVSKATVGSDRNEIDASKVIKDLEPSVDPFTYLLLSLGTEPTSSSIFEWWDSEPRPRWTKINNGAGYDNAAVSMVVDDASLLTVGSIIKIPRTGEQIRVGSVTIGTNTIASLTRGYGSTAAAAIQDNDDVLILPIAVADGYTTPEAISSQPTRFENYVETFNTPIKVTEDAEDEAKRAGGSERTRLTTEAMFQHRAGMENIILFSEKKNDTTNSILKTEGVLPRLSTNVFNQGGVALTELDFDDACVQVDNYGQTKKRIFVASGYVLSQISRFAKERIETASKDEYYGLNLKKYLASSGLEVGLVRSRALENYYAGYGFFIDLDNIKLRMKQKTKLRKDLQTGTQHLYIDELETKFGVQLRLEKMHGVITNIKVA